MLDTKQKIKNWLEKHIVQSYEINNDLSVIVFSDVFLSDKNLEEIPIVFEKIYGNFDCSHNNLIKLPIIKEIQGALYAKNNQLISVEEIGKVGKMINLNNNQLTCLKGLPRTVNGNLYISENNLKTLKYLPKKIDGSLDCSHNPLLSLNYLPEKIQKNFYCHDIAFNIEKAKGFGKLNECKNIIMNVENDIHQNLSKYYQQTPNKNNKMRTYIEISLEELIKYQHSFQLKIKMEKELTQPIKIAQPKI